MRLLWFALSLAAATCRRVEEPPPTPAPDSTSASPSLSAADGTSSETPADGTARLGGSAANGSGTGSAPADAAATEVGAPDAGRCLEPLVEPPPPVAEPASICPHDPDDATPELRHGKIKVPEAKGSPAIDVEIADTPASEQRGLMYRTKLGAERGMIFVWPKESIRTFWMHNTCLPLDMLFVAKDGTVVGILEQVPTLNDRPRQVRCPAAYVLEVNAGWSRRHGVKPGMKLELKL
ncbi:MAG TPA: DUF192 domain-containing protein [Polyangiaceae bacterium]|nr:DUF192 domain-containing protein [Polyangiaceae bacterium]